MSRIILLSLFTAILTISLQAQDTKAEASVQVMLPETQDMELLSNWTTGSRPFNDVWGYVDSNGDEVAIIGSRSHYYFVDIEDPTNPQLIDGFPGGNVTIWRDMKTYGQWAFGVCDSCSEGLSIFKMGDSPKNNGVQLVGQNTNFFSSAHNIFIDEEHGRLYAIGTNTQRNGVIILDIKTNPEAPILLAAVNVPGGYMHDLYVRDHIGYGNSENRGLFVYNFSNPTSPQFLGSLTSYLQQGYNHSGWLNPAGDVLIMADETHNTSLKAVDVSDLSDIEVTSLFRSELLAPAATGSIAHNPFVRDNYAIVSYYHDGVQVFDISDPANVEQVAWYDTFLSNTNYNGFSGCWGAYPFLPSGLILGSDGSNGLFVLNPTQITFDPIPPVIPPFAFINETISPCVPTGTPVTLSLNTDAETIQWFRNGTQVGTATSFTATSEGTYTAIVYKGPHSMTLDPVEITYGEAPDVALNIGSEVDLCSGETIELFVPAGADSYEWFLDGSSVSTQGNTFTATATGDYTVTAITGTCDATSTPVSVLVTELPEAVLNQTEDLTLCEGEFAALSTDSQGESYEWFNGSINNPILVGTGPELIVEEVGVYRVEVSNGACTTSSDFITVEFVQAPEVIFDTSEDFTFCEGESFTLTVLTSGVEYEFTGPSGFFTVGADNFTEIFEPGQIVTSVQTEFCTTTATVEIFESPLPESIITTSDNQSICNGESNLLTSQNAAESYQWFLDDAPIMGANDNTYLADQSGNYTLESTNSFDCTDMSDAYTLEVVDAPVIELVDGVNTFQACEGDVVTFQISGDADQYVWTDFEGNVFNDDTSFEFTTPREGQDVVGVVVQAFNGNCASQILDFVVEISGQPDIEIIVNNTFLCEEETTTLSAIDNNQISTPSIFTWFRNGEVIAQNETSITVDEAGAYSVESAADVCFSRTPDVVITVGGAVDAFIPMPPSLVLCQGESSTLEMLPGFASYTWSLDGLLLNETSNILEVTTSGTYIGTVITADGCDASSEAFTFTFNPLPNATLPLAADQNICEESILSLAPPQVADTYAWTFDGVIISTAANIGVNQTGTYQLELTTNGCSNTSQEINVTVDENPLIDLNGNLFDASICAGESLNTDLNQDFDTYQWFKDNDPISTEQNINITESGTYFLEAISNGCLGTSESFIVTVNTIPEIGIEVDGSTQLCEGDFTTLVAVGDTDTQITWSLDGVSLGITENTLTVTEAGNYSLQAERDGCENTSENVTVNITNNPVSEIAGESNRGLCAGESIILESLDNADSYTWFLNDDELTDSDATLEITQSGEYTLLTTLGNCETLSEPVTIQLVEIPDLDPSLFIDYTLCEGERIPVSVDIQQGELTLFRDDMVLSTGQTTFDLDTPGVYYFDHQIGDCVNRSDEFTVTSVILPSLDNLPVETSLCAGEDFTFEAPADLDTYVWTKDGVVITSAITNLLQVNEEGTYTLTIEQDGCTALSETLVVEVIILAPIQVSSIGTSICGEETVLLQLDGFDYDSTFLALDGEIISSDQNEVIITESGSYTLIGKTGDCTIESNPFEFIFNANPVVTPVEAEIFACPGDMATLAVTGDEAFDYTWSDEGGTVVGVGMSVEVMFPGVFTGEVVDPATGCAATTTVTLFNYEVTIPSIDINANILTSTDGEAYQWYLDGALIADANASVFTAETTGEYQVAVTDINGCITFSEAVLIELTSTQTISDILSADLFPNPTTDRLALTLTTEASLDLEITVYNQLGQSLWTTHVQQQGEQTYAIPVTDMTAGLYYLRVQNAQGHLQTYKFIKQ